jgi:lauroyl/myristoyl acyltransferase
MASIPIPDPTSLPPVPWLQLPRVWLRFCAYRYLPWSLVIGWTFLKHRLAAKLKRNSRERRRVKQVTDLMAKSITEDPLELAIRTEVLTHLGRNTFAPVFGRSREALIRMLQPVGLETLDELKEKGHGVIVVGSHCGYNSWYGPTLLQMGYPLHLMQRHHVSPGKLFMFRKAGWGKKLLSYPVEGQEGFHLKALHDMLREGKWVQHIADKGDRENGLVGELFGKPVRCVRAPWMLARLSNTPAVPVLVLADHKMRPQLRVGPPIYVNKKAPANDAMTEAFHKFLTFLTESLEGRRWNLHPRLWTSLTLESAQELPTPANSQ